MAAKKVKADAKESKLTPKQRLFVQYYCGNGTEAVKRAGYTGSEATLNVQATRLLRNDKIAEAIQKRVETLSKPYIMSREERQAFWSEVAKSSEQDMKDRLKASELLGKSEGDFLDRIKLSGDAAEPVRFIIEGDSG